MYVHFKATLCFNRLYHSSELWKMAVRRYFMHLKIQLAQEQLYWCCHAVDAHECYFLPFAADQVSAEIMLANCSARECNFTSVELGNWFYVLAADTSRVKWAAVMRFLKSENEWLSADYAMSATRQTKNHFSSSETVRPQTWEFKIPSKISSKKKTVDCIAKKLTVSRHLFEE